tara:strand:- start:1450 stop:1989 length:540 start_codon:yes stop_codon:yes gene_type:complete
MIRFSRPLLLAALCWALAPAAVSAQALSAQECREIRSTYGLTLPQCGTGGAITETALPSGPTERDRESSIFFSGGGATLDPAAQRQILRLAQVLNTRPLRTSCLKLVGHSDSSGDAGVNLEMGARRAAAVRDMLGNLLDTPARIEAVESAGETRPLAQLPPDSPWQRRVEIRAKLCPAP